MSIEAHYRCVDAKAASHRVAFFQFPSGSAPHRRGIAAQPKATTMPAIDDIEAAIRRQREENAQAIQVHRADSKALADMTSRLNAAINGQITDVDIAKLVAEINDAAQELHNGISVSHTSAVGAQTANASTSVVQDGSAAGPDVVSASSPGVVVPPASGTEASNAVPETLGGGAMPRAEITGGATSERAPGEPVPAAKGGDEPTPASPDVPSVADVPDVGDAGTKGGKAKG